MNKIFALAWKELFTTLQDRNLILIMFLTPIVLSTIMGLAFGGLGSDSSNSAFSHLPVAIVNLDQGVNLADQFDVNEDGLPDEEMPSLNDLELSVGGQNINVGEELLQNDNLDLVDTDLSVPDVSFNFGEQLTNILMAVAVTETETVTDESGSIGSTMPSNAFAFNLEDVACPLFDELDDDHGNSFSFTGTLDELFDAVELTDAAEAKSGVEQGKYVAAVIIPAGFSDQVVPFGNAGDAGSSAADANGVVQIYGNSGQAIGASIVRAVVEGVVNQFLRIKVALSSITTASFDFFTTRFDILSLNLITSDLSALDPAAISTALQNVDLTLFEPLGCLIVPQTGHVQLRREPLDLSQTRSAFGFIMVILGAAQAMFFAMFTGIFGINSIYQERHNWTLQRLMATPTPGSSILAGKLLGNLVVVALQLVILFTSFTLIASLVEGEPTFIWGTNLPALLVTILGISLFVSGLGVAIVGLARSEEQVQLIGPMIAAGLGALGGSFGFRLPPQIAGVSPIWWGAEALKRLSNDEPNIGLPLLVLFGFGAALFVVGTYFFKRRIEF